MPSLLRLSDFAWPCSRADLERDNPATWFPPDLADAEPLADFGYALPKPTDPPEHDPATHRAVEVMPVQAPDGNWQQAWELVALPPPPEPEPQPDWGQFKLGLLTSPDVARIMANARAAGCEPAATALPVTLETAQTGRVSEFAACWRMVAVAGGATPKVIEELAARAEACHLPEDFMNGLRLDS